MTKKSPPKGSIVLQTDSPEMHPVDLIIEWKSPHYAHCGIYIGTGKMVASALALGGVSYQECSEADDTIYPAPWKVDPSKVLSWATLQLGKRYDLFAWVLNLLGTRHPIPTNVYDCSSFVGAALNLFASCDNPYYRESTPDDIARGIGILK